MAASSFIPLIGLAAAFVTTVCWLPQAVQIIRTKDTRAISLPAYAAFAAGIGLWLVYGVALGDAPLILANGITLALQLVIVGLKVKYG